MKKPIQILVDHAETVAVIFFCASAAALFAATIGGVSRSNYLRFELVSNMAISFGYYVIKLKKKYNKDY